jgi:DNA-binding protein HU-beta
VPNKAQFIDLLAERLDVDKKTASTALDAVLDTGFGIFEKRERGPRLARNPATGASVKVKKTSVPAFRAGAEFKAVTSGAKKLAKAPAKKAPGKKAPAKKAAAKKTAAKTTAAKKAAR